MVPAWAELWFAWINLDLSGNSYLICAFMHNKFFGVLQCAVYEMIGMSDLIFLSRWYSRLHSRIMCRFQLIAVFYLWHDITKAHKLIACKISFLQVVGHSQNLGYVNYLLYHGWFLILWYKSSVDKKKPWNLWMLFQLVSLVLSFNGQGTHLFLPLWAKGGLKLWVPLDASAEGTNMTACNSVPFSLSPVSSLALLWAHWSW